MQCHDRGEIRRIEIINPCVCCLEIKMVRRGVISILPLHNKAKNLPLASLKKEPLWAFLIKLLKTQIEFAQSIVISQLSAYSITEVKRCCLGGGGVIL